MVARLRLAAVSFLAVAAAYWAYALVAVPLIEPRAAGPTAASEELAPPTRPYESALEKYFPPGAWERDRAKVLETEQATLLLKDYRVLDDRRIKVWPLAAVYHPSGRKTASGAVPARALVLQAPDGAILKFDRTVDLRKAQFGQLVGGRLLGEITIRAAESRPGAGDDLHLVTRNLQLDRDRIWTPADARFRLGRHFGSGSKVIITLGPAAKGDPTAWRSPAVGGVRSLEVVHVEKVHFELGRADMFSRRATGRADSTPTPVEITCRGPFLLDLVENVASFDDRVDVLRLVPDGSSDRLSCQRLEIRFTRGEKTAAAVDEIVATGRPVVIDSPSMEIAGRGRRLSYRPGKTRRLRIEDNDGASLRYRQRRVRAVAIEYEPAESSSKVGRIWAAGPGTFRETDDDGHPTIDVAWGGELRLRPVGDSQVLSLSGGAKAGFADNGTIAADEFHLWMLEVPGNVKNGRESGGKGQESGVRSQGSRVASHEAEKTSLDTGVTLLPDRMMALGRVRIDSPALTGRTDRLEVWLERRGRPAASASPGSRFGAEMPRTAGEEKSGEPFSVDGRLLKVLLVQDSERTDVKEVTVDGDARIAGRGITLAGDTVRLDRAANRLTIDGPGQMTLPVGLATVAGSEPRRNEPSEGLTVTWSGGMGFDGRVARFQRDVTAGSAGRRISSDWLDVVLSRSIDFSRPGKHDDVDVRQITFHGDVSFEGRTFEDGRQLSIDRMQVRNLDIDRQTGRIHADGPGWMSTIRRGSPPGLAVAGLPEPEAARPRGDPGDAPRAAADDDRLMYLHVRFQREITGNLDRREIQLHKQVKAIYGPVDGWTDRVDVESPEGLGPSGLVLTCDRLTVAEMGPRVGSRAMLELEALGNTLVEGRTFTARGRRISYAQAKDLLILEGDGRADAQLWRQSRVGGPTARVAAQKILYWRGKNRVEVDQARFLDLDRPGS